LRKTKLQANILGRFGVPKVGFFLAEKTDPGINHVFDIFFT
jgi:hypothetical protein